MTLRFGPPVVAIPGPSIIPDRVLDAMRRPMPNIYAGELIEVNEEIFAGLGAVARTAGESFVIISNGHGGWQMALCNTLSAGEKVLVCESGRFALIWGDMAALSGLQVEILGGTDRDPVDPVALAERLANDPYQEIAAILIAQTDTASSVRNDIEAIGSVVKDAGHRALLMVDCIASMGCEQFEMDAWGVDIAVAGSQKGLMVPPGLGFCWAGPRALEAYKTAGLRIGMLDWEPRMNPQAIYSQYSGTPPITHMYGLREALRMINEEGGMDAVWVRHEALANAVRAAVETWSTPGGLELIIKDPAHRSNAVTTVLTGQTSADELRSRCEHGAGLTLGIGIGELSEFSFRIGHMGHLNPPSILGTLGTIEAGLIAIGSPLGGSGVAAAAEVIAKSL
jgi:alanine-glyoxylate transaminase/serine-glyoxylate transaminase/serine-pyruvate transaminase